MQNKKRTIIICVLVGLLVVALAVGATFAFFTDSVVSQGNKVKAGTLKVDLELLKNGRYTSIKKDPQAIFSYELWEPGFTDVKLMRVVNNGSLALKWEAKLTTTGTLNELADEIQVYVLNKSTTEIAQPENLAAVKGWTPAGTLAEFFANAPALLNGTLVAAPDANSPQYAYIAIALHMPTTVGNTNAEDVELQDLALPTFDIQILATQLTYESDAFDNQYDVNACNHANTAVIPGTPATYEATGLTDGVKCATCEKVLVEQEEIPVLTDLTFIFWENGDDDYYSAQFNGPFVSENLVVPTTYAGLPVREIAGTADPQTNNVTKSITIPKSVTRIEFRALACSYSLETITLTNSVKYISYTVFYGAPLQKIVFKGTVAEWNAIEKQDGWNESTGDYTIYCTDGEITKAGVTTMYPTE